ncbi:MAG: dockerin type I repeat-containing protein [Oscillospiraceae bacterium]|nr:dockerin type I repeat-containing protein [Oscillospiraceae bacterium]
MKKLFIRLISAVLTMLLCVTVFPWKEADTLKGNAADGRLYNQYDPYWKTIVYTQYSSSGSSMYSSGCGIFSFCNAMYALNSTVLEPTELAEWGIKNKGYRPGSGGLYRDDFYKNVEEEWGEKASFHIEAKQYGTVKDAALKNHLKNGGTAVIHVTGHFMALSGYNQSADMFHVLESAVSSSRNLAADSWVTSEKLQTGKTAVDWYVLFSSTKAPTYAKVSLEKSIYGVNEPICFEMVNDERSYYGLGINNDKSERLITLYENERWAGVTRHLTAELEKPGTYSAYITARNELGMIDSTPLLFYVYDEAPSDADLECISQGRVGEEPVKFSISGQIATSYAIECISETGQVFHIASDEFEMISGETVVAWEPEYPGKYTCTLTLGNYIGTCTSDAIDITVAGTVPVYLNDGWNDTQCISLEYGNPIGTLPEPEHLGYKMLGWFTAADESGRQIQEQDLLLQPSEQTYYAHWEKLPPLKADMNDDYQIDLQDVGLFMQLLTQNKNDTFNETVLENADTNDDGIIDLTDLAYMMQLILSPAAE